MEKRRRRRRRKKRRKTIYCAIIKRSLSMNSRTPDCNLCKRNQKDHLGRLFCNGVPLLARGRGRCLAASLFSPFLSRLITEMRLWMTVRLTVSSCFRAINGIKRWRAIIRLFKTYKYFHKRDVPFFFLIFNRRRNVISSFIDAIHHRFYFYPNN